MAPTRRRIGASHPRLTGSSGPAGETDTGAAIRASSETLVPCRPVGREAFRSAAPREMSLMLSIPYPKRSRTRFERAE
jgi:hypothetical protein